MLCYAALSGSEKFYKTLVKKEVKANNLLSFYAPDTKYINHIKKISNNLLIDSGAFSLFSQSNNVDIDNYFKQYLEFIKKNDGENIVGYFELDIHDIIGYEKVKYFRNKLFEVTDKIIPVWHRGLGVEEFKKMVNDYEYISIGGIVSSRINPEVFSSFVKYAHKRNTKIHGLGVTKHSVITSIPFDSVDSMSWKCARWGNMITFEKNKLNSYKLNSKWLSKNYESVDIVSYINFVKFQEYIHEYWEKRYSY